MAKAKKTSKLVLTSVILSILILAAFTAVFIRVIVPAYDITREQIYSVLAGALPILIGLVFIEIAIVSSSRHEEGEYLNTIDKLAPNAYDSPLYTEPVDDPAAGRVSGEEFNLKTKEPLIKEVVKEVPVEVVKEVIKEIPVEVIREVPVEVETVKEVPVEVVKEVVKEVPVEVVKEVPVEIVREVVREVPVELPPKESEIIIRNNYIPVEIKVPEEVVVEKPVEVVKEVEVVREVPVETAAAEEGSTPPEEEEVYMTFLEALTEEIDEAHMLNYPLTLISLKGDDEEKVKKTFDAPVFSENGFVYAILPFTRRKDILRNARLMNASVLEMDANATAASMVEKINK